MHRSANTAVGPTGSPVCIQGRAQYVYTAEHNILQQVDVNLHETHAVHVTIIMRSRLRTNTLRLYQKHCLMASFCHQETDKYVG